MAEKWAKILKLGLPKDIREKIVKKHPVPKNCATLNAPMLNAEVKSLLTVGRKKDAYQAAWQHQIGVATGMLGKALTDIAALEKSPEIANIFEIVSDASRLLADMHHTISMTRRLFALPSLGLNAKNIAEEAPIDSLLFGENFAEKLKLANEVEKSAKTIAKSKDYSSNKIYNRESSSSGFKKDFKTPAKAQTNPRLNWKGPSKRSQSSYQGPRSKGGPRQYSSQKQDTLRK